MTTRTAFAFTVTMGGQEFTQRNALGLESMDVEDHVDMIGVARLTFGTALHDWGIIQIGDPVTVRVDGDTPWFDGVITGFRHIERRGRESVVVTAMDPLVKLTSSRRTETYVAMKDSDIVQQVLGRAGLTSGDITATTDVRPHVLQRNESDLEFLKRLAARNDVLLRAVAGKIDFSKPQVSGNPVELGADVVESLDYSVSVVQVPPKMTVVGWDPVAAERVEGSAQGSDLAQIGGGTLATEVSSRIWKDQSYVSDVVVDAQSGAKAIAVAELERLARTLVRGHATVVGNASLVAGQVIALSGRRDGFNPTGYVVASKHRFDVGQGYTTEVQFCANTLPE